MPAKGSAAPSSTPARAPAYIAPSPPPATSGNGQIITGYRPYFVLVVHPHRYEPTGGLLLPVLSRIDAAPGVAGNDGSDRAYPSGALSGMTRQGYVLVPDDLEYMCWGSPRSTSTSASGCTYRDWYASSAQAGIFAEAWSRPRLLAGRTKWYHDIDGKRSYQAAVLQWLRRGEPIEEDVIEAALAAPIEIARGYTSAALANPTAMLRLREILAQLPTDRIPSDLRRYQET